MDPREKTVELRPFPYPYRAALALCNDADSLTPDSFRRLYRFLTGNDETEWGPGLGLDVGGSFFMFRSPDSPNELTVFDRLSSTVTDDGEYLLDCIRGGLLDILHTYGCFTSRDDFTRELAVRALELLASRGIKIETWVNHGPPTNVQCIGTHEGWQGDAPGSRAYHADLTVAHGVRWIWTGDEISDRVALDGPSARRTPLSRRSRPLTEPYRMRDDQVVESFVRYGGLGRRQTPVLDDLPHQLAPSNLDALVKAGGYSIVYQHLAVRRVRPGFGVGAYGPVDDRWFRAAELTALRELARRFRDGEIWVAPTTTLLRYRDARANVRWHLETTDEHDRIVVEPGPDPAWLTFYCERPGATTVHVRTADGQELAVDTDVNPPDERGRPSVTVVAPRKRSELP